MCDDRPRHKVQSTSTSGQNGVVSDNDAPHESADADLSTSVDGSNDEGANASPSTAVRRRRFMSATTGRDALGYPDQIVGVSPAPNDRQVLSQTEISVDLIDGYEAELILDGITIPTTRLEDAAPQDVKPGQQIELPKTAIYDQGNSLIRFEPTEGAAVEKYDVGVHKVTVLFWKIEEGRNTARSFSWSFEVL
jgi:hypothetical protein